MKSLYLVFYIDPRKAATVTGKAKVFFHELTFIYFPKNFKT